MPRPTSVTIRSDRFWQLVGCRDDSYQSRAIRDVAASLLAMADAPRFSRDVDSDDTITTGPILSDDDVLTVETRTNDEGPVEVRAMTISGALTQELTVIERTVRKEG